jgi:hypothetical protein
MATSFTRTQTERFLWAVVWTVFWMTAAASIVSRLTERGAAERPVESKKTSRGDEAIRTEFARLPRGRATRPLASHSARSTSSGLAAVALRAAIQDARTAAPPSSATAAA